MLRAILSDKQIEVAELYAVEGYSHRRIADLLNRTQPAVTQMIARIDARLGRGGIPPLRRGGVGDLHKSTRAVSLSDAMIGAI